MAEEQVTVQDDETSELVRIDDARPLPHGLAVLKIENETMIQAAAAKPRDNFEITEQVTEQLARWPTFVEAATYDVPVGKDDQGREHRAKGLSIRMAESLAEAYGYNRIDEDQEIIDDKTVKVVTTFTDFQNHRVMRRASLVSREYKTKRGGSGLYPRDRFLKNVVPSMQARVTRECILRSIPAGMRHELMARVETEQRKLIEGDAWIDKSLGQYEMLGVSLEMLESKLEKPRGEWDSDDRMRLLGIWNALRDKESTLAEEFPQLAPDEAGDDMSRTQEMEQDLLGDKP